MAVSPERLQAVAWWNLQIVEACGGIKNGELAEGHTSDAPKAPHRLSRKQGPGVSATKRPDHTATLPPPDVGTPSGGAGRRRSRADMAAWLACVLPLTSATPVTPQPGCPYAPTPFPHLRTPTRLRDAVDAHEPHLPAIDVDGTAGPPEPRPSAGRRPQDPRRGRDPDRLLHRTCQAKGGQGAHRQRHHHLRQWGLQPYRRMRAERRRAR